MDPKTKLPDKNAESRKEPEKINYPLAIIEGIFILAAIYLLGSVFFSSCTVNRNTGQAAPGDSQKIETQMKESEQHKSTTHDKMHAGSAVYTDYGDHLAEMLDSFRKVFAQNQNAFVIESASFTGPDTLVLGVNPQWYNASTGQKKATIESALKLWAGMAGARGINVNLDNFEVKVIDPTTNKELAKWGSIRGTRIFDE